MTNLAVAQTTPTKKLSTQMCALLFIFSADSALMAAVETCVDLKTESIDWPEIRRRCASPGHLAAISLAYAIWTDQIMEGCNPFELALNMDAKLQRSCLQALAMRWGHKA